MTNNIPSEYESFDKLIICSNTLIAFGAIFKIGDIEPIIVGKGLKLPTIWLRAKSNKKDWVSIVERSVSLNSQIQILDDVNTGSTIIKAQNIIILSAKQNGSTCVIDNLDLRPLGLDITGNSAYLNVGGSKFSGNTFQGVGTFIGIGDK